MQTIEQIIKGLKTETETKESIKHTGIPSGFARLDKHTTGFQNGQLTILGGHPGIGSTTFSLNIARNISEQTDKRIAVFILDRSAKQWTNLFIKKYISKSKTDLRQKIEKLTTHPIFIEDTQDISVFEIMEKAISLKRNQNIDFLIIDYLQLITGIEQSTTNSEKNIYEKITRLLRILSKSLNIPILLLSTLSHRTEKKSGKNIPKLKHLNEYGTIERYAEVVLLLYRWEYYGFEEDEFGDDLSNKSVLIIAKNRNGAITDVNLRHNFETATFIDN